MEKTTKEMKLIPIDELIPYVNNARTHSPEQINKLRASLREFGFINPVIIDKDKNIIAGHGRVMAAREEGIQEVPCVLVDYLTDAQKKAYILADNRMALDAGWDEEILRVEIESLQGADFDVSLTGFDEDEIAHIFDEETEAKEDDFDVEEELQKPVFSKAGDLWQLGKTPGLVRRFYETRNLCSAYGWSKTEPGPDGSSVPGESSKRFRENQER